MKIFLLSTIAVLATIAGMFVWSTEPAYSASTRTPVLVELFTSEGCSSCPPADAFLQKLDQQPVPGEEMIVLSEHVDYWNHIGWKDPYSARYFSDRQSAYGRHFGLESVYTPQMVVDGSSEFTGSDTAQANKAFAKAMGNPKIAVALSSVKLGGPNVVQAHLDIGPLPASFEMAEAEVYVAVALNRAESQVSHGENAGRRLVHVAVVRSMVKVGVLRQGQKFGQDVQLRLEPGTDTGNLRLITFLQGLRQGRVIGAAAQTVDAALAQAN